MGLLSTKISCDFLLLTLIASLIQCSCLWVLKNMFSKWYSQYFDSDGCVTLFFFCVRLVGSKFLIFSLFSTSHWKSSGHFHWWDFYKPLFKTILRLKITNKWTVLLGILNYWVNIHLSVSIYYVCTFVSGLPHSGWYIIDPFIGLCISGSHCF